MTIVRRTEDIATLIPAAVKVAVTRGFMRIDGIRGTADVSVATLILLGQFNVSLAGAADWAD